MLWPRSTPSARLRYVDTTFGALFWAILWVRRTPRLSWHRRRNGGMFCQLCDRVVATGPPSRVTRLVREHERYHANRLGRERCQAAAAALAIRETNPRWDAEAGAEWAMEVVRDFFGDDP